MTDYRVTVLLNVTEPFRAHRNTHRVFEAAHGFVTAETEEQALEAAFRWGNKMGLDAHGAAYPAMARSLSVGDVVTVERIGTDWPRSFACESAGWKRVLTPPKVVRVDKTYAVVQGAVSEDFVEVAQ